MCCAIRVATARISFRAPEVRRGWHAGPGDTSILPRLVGYGDAPWVLTDERQSTSIAQ